MSIANSGSVGRGRAFVKRTGHTRSKLRAPTLDPRAENSRSPVLKNRRTPR